MTEKCKQKISLLNGPNLNKLGARLPEVYGSITLEEIERDLRELSENHGFYLEATQTNSEGELVDAIQRANISASGIIINAAAYTHTSIAIHDALEASGIPIIEVHLSNIFKREEFRHFSFISRVSDGIICGLGPLGYRLALEAVVSLIRNKESGV